MEITMQFLKNINSQQDNTQNNHNKLKPYILTIKKSALWENNIPVWKSATGRFIHKIPSPGVNYNFGVPRCPLDLFNLVFFIITGGFSGFNYALRCAFIYYSKKF